MDAAFHWLAAGPKNVQKRLRFLAVLSRCSLGGSFCSSCWISSSFLWSAAQRRAVWVFLASRAAEKCHGTGMRPAFSHRSHGSAPSSSTSPGPAAGWFVIGCWAGVLHESWARCVPLCFRKGRNGLISKNLRVGKSQTSTWTPKILGNGADHRKVDL